MGLRLASIFANIFIEWLEQKCIETCKILNQKCGSDNIAISYLYIIAKNDQSNYLNTSTLWYTVTMHNGHWKKVTLSKRIKNKIKKKQMTVSAQEFTENKTRTDKYPHAKTHHCHHKKWNWSIQRSPELLEKQTIGM